LAYNKGVSELIFVTKPSAAAKEAEDYLRSSLSGKEFGEILVIAIGGDGTLLHAIKHHQDKGAIFIGISAGSLGLLQTVDTQQLPQLVEALSHKNYHIVEAPLLEAAYTNPQGDDVRQDQPSEIIGYGFNDISVERSGSRAAKFHLKVDTSSGTFIGDGVIFSTPLGSTAYSLAAGGPIIDSKLQDIFVVTPNNPHLSSINSSLQRPHVLSRNRKIRIEMAPEDIQNRPLQIAIDGHVAVKAVEKPINIFISGKKVRLLQLEADSIQDRIENKRLGRL
jgi:NAD+ kinase